MSGMKNLKQIAEDSSYSFGMISRQKARDSSHTLGMTFGLLPAKNVVILNGMQWSEESPKK